MKTFASLRKSKSGKKSGNQQSDDHDDVQMSASQLRSFQRLVHPTGGEGQVMNARVNIIEATGTYDRMKDRNNQFFSLVTLIKGRKIFDFRVVKGGLCPANEDDEETVKRVSSNVKVEKMRIRSVDVISGIVDFTKTRKSFIINFVQQDRIELEFYNQVDAFNFCKKLNVLFRSNKKYDLIDTRRPLNDIMNYRIPSSPKSSESSSLFGLSASPACSSLSTNNIMDFYDIKAKDWNLGDLKKFLKFVFVQESPAGKIITFHEALSQAGVLSDLFKYLKRKENVKKNIYHINEFMLAFEENQKSKSFTLSKRRKKIEEEEVVNTEISVIEIPSLLKDFVANPFFRETWKKEVRFIQDHDGWFNMPYTRILQKKIRTINKKLKKNKNNKNNMVLNISLDQFKEKYLFGAERMFWDYQEMRDFIICQLLFQKNFEEILGFYESLFLKFLRKRISSILIPSAAAKIEKEEVEGEEEEEEEEEEDQKKKDDDDEEFLKKFDDFSLISPQKYLKLVEEFSELEGCEIGHMSFKIYLKCLQCRLTMEKSVLEKDLEKQQEEYNEIKLGKDKISMSIDSKTENKKTYMSNILSEGALDLVKFDNLIESLDNSINDLKTDELRIQMDLEKKMNEIDEQRRKIMDLDLRIRLSSPELGAALAEARIYLSLRRKAWTKFLRKMIEMTVEEKGYVEITAKLVLSTLRNNNNNNNNNNNIKKKKSKRLVDPQKIGEGAVRLAMGWIEPIFSPGFFEWGFLHTSVLLGSLQLHWFANGFVYLNRLSLGKKYDEVFCVDANCPLILNQRTIYQYIEDLAYEIVSINVNNEYDQLRGTSKNNNIPKKKKEEEEEIEEEEEQQQKQKEKKKPKKKKKKKNIKKDDPGKLNCQQFSKRILRSLNATEFYEKTKEYRKLVVKKLCTGSGGIGFSTADSLRFLVVDKKFQKKFSTVLAEQRRYFPKDENGKKFVYFISHRDLDEFYIQCLTIDSFFQLNFPGEYQLLKGFDRAFWMRRDMDKSNEFLKPAQNCPFNPQEHEKIIKQQQQNMS